MLIIAVCTGFLKLTIIEVNINDKKNLYLEYEYFLPPGE